MQKLSIKKYFKKNAHCSMIGFTQKSSKTYDLYIFKYELFQKEFLKVLFRLKNALKLNKARHGAMYSIIFFLHLTYLGREVVSIYK